MASALLTKPVLIALGILLSMLLMSAGYAAVLSLQLDTARLETAAAKKDLAAAQAALEATRADRDRQVGALARQVEATAAALDRSAGIMRIVNAAPPSASCAASSRITAYLGELRRTPAPAGGPDRPARGTDPLPSRAAPARADRR